MPGNRIKSQQVEIYMKYRKAGYIQEAAAAKAGISVRSARDIEHGNHETQKQDRHWRTRKNPFNDVWERELVPLLEMHPTLQAITLLEYLQEKYVGIYPDSVLRTLQRHVKLWKAIKGAEKEVIFRQLHEPGRLGLSDFTTLKDIVITVGHQPLPHLLYHYRLAYSHWSYLKVILGGESYTALAEGLQEALWRLGGCPQEHRTDSLSAAFKNLSKEACADITTRYEALCDYYTMKASRNNPGISHENGSVESPHGHLKRRIKQALLLRGSYNFDSVADYQNWIDSVVQQHNRRNAKAVEIERASLQVLPHYKTTDYTEVVVKVTSSSTIDVRRVTYTVPSKLQGETLRIHLYHDRLSCYLGSSLVATLNRIYPAGKTARARNINYHHVIHSLIKKPQAFRYSQIREELLPNDHYREIWSYVDNKMEAKQACKFIVGILYLAATENCEQRLSEVILQKIQRGQPLQLSQLQDEFRKNPHAMPDITVSHHVLTHYNHLIPHHQEVGYV